MGSTTTAPYGSWASPISTDLIVAKAIALSSIAVDGAEIYWTEGRPNEGGRMVIVRRSTDGKIDDLTPARHSTPARGSTNTVAALYLVDRGTVYFSNYRRSEALSPGSRCALPGR